MQDLVSCIVGGLLRKSLAIGGVGAGGGVLNTYEMSPVQFLAKPIKSGQTYFRKPDQNKLDFCNHVFL